MSTGVLFWLGLLLLLSLVFLSAQLYLLHLAPVLWQCKSARVTVSPSYHKMAQKPLSWSLHILYRAVYSDENVCVQTPWNHRANGCSFSFSADLGAPWGNCVRFGMYCLLGIIWLCWSKDPATSQPLWSCSTGSLKGLGVVLVKHWKHPFSNILLALPVVAFL